MAENYHRLQEDMDQLRNAENTYKDGMYDLAPGAEGVSRTPPPPYGIDMKPQPYGMVSSPVNPMMPQQLPAQQGYTGPPQQQGYAGPPQQQGYAGPPQPVPQTQVVNIVAQPQYTGPSSVGQDPIRIRCPSCHEFIKSKVNRKCICKTHMWACCLCLFFCWPCMCIPYCSNGCRDAIHTCPNCSAYLGTYKA